MLISDSCSDSPEASPSLQSWRTSSAEGSCPKQPALALHSVSSCGLLPLSVLPTTGEDNVFCPFPNLPHPPDLSPCFISELTNDHSPEMNLWVINFSLLHPFPCNSITTFYLLCRYLTYKDGLVLFFKKMATIHVP